MRAVSRGRRASLQLRLYVAGGAPNSLTARANLATLAAALGHPGLEIVDVLDDPVRALTDGILVTPTLVKIAPSPVCRIIGNLSDARRVLALLGGP